MAIETKRIGTVTVESREWTKNDQNRIYFDAGDRGQACWDVSKSEWVKVRNEFGARFKSYIKDAFSL